MKHGRWMMIALLLGCLPLKASAEEPTVQEYGAKIAAAVDAQDEAALAKLAAVDGDAWMIVDDLFGRGRLDAARAYAALREGAADEKLAVYVESLKGVEIDKEIRAAFDLYRKEAQARRMPQAMKALDLKVPMTPMRSIMVQQAQGLYRHQARDPAGAAAIFAKAAQQAEDLGWVRRAAEIHKRAVYAYQQLGHMQHMYETSGRVAKLAGQIADVELEVWALNVSSGILIQTEQGLEIGLAGFERCLKLLAGAANREARGTRMLVLTNMANAERDLDRLESAEAHIREGMVLAKELDDEINYARGVMVLAGIEEQRGHYEPAIASYERALQLLRDYVKKTLATQPLNAQRALGGAGITAFNIAALHAKVGAFAKALDAFDVAIQFGTDARDMLTIADSLMQKGYIQRRIGQRTQAREAYAKVIPLYERMRNEIQIASVYQAIGTTWALDGEHEKALAAFEESVKRYDALKEPMRAAHARASMASALVFLDRRAEAKTLLDGAVDAARLHTDALHVYEFLINRAALHRTMGDLPAAVKDIEEAVAMDNTKSPVIVVALAYQTLARIRHHQGRLDDAMKAARTGILHLEKSQAGLAEQEAAGARERWQTIFDEGIAAALTAREPGKLLWFLERGRGQLLAGSLGSRDAVLAANVPGELLSEEASARLRVTRAREAISKAKKRRSRATLRRARAALAKAMGEHEAALLKVQRRARSLADVAFVEPVKLDELQAALGEDEALVLYAHVGSDVFALRVTRAASAIIPLGDKQALLAAIAAADMSEVGNAPATPLAALARRLLAPLKLSKATKTVYVSAQGQLSYVPLAALDTTRAFAWIPSATTWKILRQESALAGSGVLAVGDPDYTAPRRIASAARSRAGTLVRLPATRDEVEAIGSVKLLGLDASETMVAAAVGMKSRWRAIHFACHGLLDSEQPQFSSLALTPTDESDGFLTVAEVAGSKFPADLVVLSACETAKGKVYEAEGVMGLTRAFMIAGAPRVICSQWPVDDEATMVLMLKFYELWNAKDGKPAAEALRLAQAHVRSHPKWKHPYYWSAWTLWGLAR